MQAQANDFYPENIRDYDHNPGSPFFEEPKEEDDIAAHGDNEWSED